jgi:ABC-type glutathione transport system ATPase component
MSEPSARAGGPLLEVEGLDVVYGRGAARRHALRGATFNLNAGEKIGIIGETGSGKTTLARAILGLVKPSAGRVRLDGRPLTQLNAKSWRDLRRRGTLQYVFQDPLRSMDPDVTVEETLAEPLLIRGTVGRDDIEPRVHAHLQQVNLEPEVLRRYPGELSGGQRQRVAIARALITEPRLLILDEPVSALDSANRVQVLQLLGRQRSSEVGMLFISHDLGSVAGLTDRIVVMRRGEIVEIGSTGAVINHPQHHYTRLLVGSAPTLASGAFDRRSRDVIRASLLGPVPADPSTITRVPSHL